MPAAGDDGSEAIGAPDGVHRLGLSRYTMKAMPRPRSTVSTAVVPGQAATRIADRSRSPVPGDNIRRLRGLPRGASNVQVREALTRTTLGAQRYRRRRRQL